MKTEYEFIRMEQHDSVWCVLNKKSGDELGEVRWHYPWRQYCYFPSQPAVYSAGCLDDIQAFIEEARTEK